MITISKYMSNWSMSNRSHPLFWILYSIAFLYEQGKLIQTICSSFAVHTFQWEIPFLSKWECLMLGIAWCLRHIYGQWKFTWAFHRALTKSVEIILNIKPFGLQKGQFLDTFVSEHSFNFYVFFLYPQRPVSVSSFDPD